MKLAKLVATLAVVLGALVLPASGQAACEPNICLELEKTTDADGVLSIGIPGGFIGSPYIYPDQADCKWQLTAEFGDGSDAKSYEFQAKVGLEAAHAYPAPGTYATRIFSTSSEHTETGGPCKTVTIDVAVTFPQPPPPTAEPPPPGTESPEGTTGGGSRPGGGAVTGAGDDGPGIPGTLTGNWRRCKHDVFTHRLPCGKGLRIAERALDALDGRRGTIEVRGFTCKLRPSRARPLSCARGARRILGPVGFRL